MTDLVKPLSYASIAFGVLLYVASVAGLWGDGAAGAGDVGALSTGLVFVLLGLGGIWLGRAQPKSGQ